MEIAVISAEVTTLKRGNMSSMGNVKGEKEDWRKTRSSLLWPILFSNMPAFFINAIYAFRPNI